MSTDIPKLPTTPPWLNNTPRTTPTPTPPGQNNSAPTANSPIPKVSTPVVPPNVSVPTRPTPPPPAPTIAGGSEFSAPKPPPAESVTLTPTSGDEVNLKIADDTLPLPPEEATSIDKTIPRTVTTTPINRPPAQTNPIAPTPPTPSEITPVVVNEVSIPADTIAPPLQQNLSPTQNSASAQSSSPPAAGEQQPTIPSWTQQINNHSATVPLPEQPVSPQYQQISTNQLGVQQFTNGFHQQQFPGNINQQLTGQSTGFDTPPPGQRPPGFDHDPMPNYGPTHQHGMAPASLEDVALLRRARRAPTSGWRRIVHKVSGGALNPGESTTDIQFQHLLERVIQPVRGDYRIAVLSLKGGVGKTTTTVGLGSTYSAARGDRVIAVDANPDLGTLSQRIPQQTRSTVRDVLSDQNIYRYSDVRAHTSQAPSRLEVLASERDPAVSEAFSESDYRGVMRVLQRFYNIIITDCGTGLSHSAMTGVLDMANTLILVSSPAIDGARSAVATLDWLDAHGYGHLVTRSVVVLSLARQGNSGIDLDQLAQHFLTRCRAVHTIPFDRHLAEGAEIDLDLLNKRTRNAFIELAATVADDFPRTTPRLDPYNQYFN